MRLSIVGTRALLLLALILPLSWPTGAQTVDVIEYYNASRDHYFISSLPPDIEALDSGKFAGWSRTGRTFKAYSQMTAGASPVCRFYIPPAGGDSHFFSASPTECAQTAAKFPTFIEESAAVMYIDLPDPTTGACPAGDVPVYRVWDGRVDSNHRYTTDLAIRGQMVAKGWVAEGYGPNLVIMCAPPTPQPRGTRQLLIRAWNPDGTVATIDDLLNYVNYVTSKWSQIGNFGVFPIGKSPATRQIGSWVYPVRQPDGVDYVAIDVLTDQPFYFTALWKAPVIGTVFMRADNGGAGFPVNGNQPQKLELPYDFALAEFQKARTLLPAGSLSPEAQSLLARATAAVDAAKNATTPAARAVAAYTALSFVMPLKERLVLDASNKSISTTGLRSDFDLNYEGFGGWIADESRPGFAIAKDAGFKSVLTTIDWNRTSPTRGAYDFSLLDWEIDQARAQGFQVALEINLYRSSFPAWVQNLSFDELKTLYYENARIMVARYGSKVSWWYPCGELELNTGDLTFEQVAELARQSLNGARAAAPGTPYGIYVSASAYVPGHMSLGSHPGYFEGIELIGYLARNDIKFDFLGLEMQYGTTFAPIDLQRFQEVLQDTYDVAKIPIYMGETGYSSKSEDYGIQARFFWHDGLTQQAQYEWADGTLRILYAMPFVKGYYWVHLDPDNNDRGSDYLSSLLGTNLVRADGTVKKAFHAFKDFNTQIHALVAGSSGPPASLTIVRGGEQGAPADSAYSLPLKVLVRDYFGNPVPGASVTFTASVSGASGLPHGQGLSAIASTDSAGLASVPPFGAPAVAMFGAGSAAIPASP